MESFGDFIEQVGVWAALVIGLLVGFYKIAVRLIEKCTPIAKTVADAHVSFIKNVGEANKMNAKTQEQLATASERIELALAEHGERLGEVGRQVADVKKHIAGEASGRD